MRMNHIVDWLFVIGWSQWRSSMWNRYGINMCQLNAQVLSSVLELMWTTETDDAWGHWAVQTVFTSLESLRSPDSSDLFVKWIVLIASVLDTVSFRWGRPCSRILTRCVTSIGVCCNAIVSICCTTSDRVRHSGLRCSPRTFCRRTWLMRSR